MGANNRIKELRKTLNLSQDAFGEKLGIKKSAVSKIEKGENGLKDQLAKLICRTFNVDYLWLTEGKGEMFETPGSALDDLAMQYNLNEMDLCLIKAYLDLSKEGRSEFAEIIMNKLLAILKKELHTNQKH